jgi:hypothetical protein
MTQAYVYKWTEHSTGKWYIGSRTGKNCHLDDGYICSSNTVKPLIKANPGNWSRQIICIGHPSDMLELEFRYLTALDAVNDPMSYNQSNGGYNFGRTGKTHSEETKAKMSEVAQNRPQVTCPHCGKIGGTGVMNRWHMDNCRHK